jgi:hypothetical protein
LRYLAVNDEVKMPFKGDVRVWSGFTWLRIDPVADGCEQHEESLGSVKAGNLIY